MSVRSAFKASWEARRVVLPLFVAVRLLSAGIITPLLAVLIPLALSVSGQAALTDQDIAYFLFSPVGFLVFLGVFAVVLTGSVIGIAAMTVNLRQRDAGTLASLRMTLALLARRLPQVAAFAVRLVLRVLVTATPFVLLGLIVARRFLTEFDINYYLSARPPEFLWAVALIGALVLGMIAVLLPRLLSWAVSLHLVVFDQVAPRDAFAQSTARMAGHRASLLMSLLGWAALRTALLAMAGVVFAVFFRAIADPLGDGLRLMLTVSMALVAVWSLANLVIAAIALGALARILDGFHGTGSSALADPASDAPGLSLRALGLGAVVMVAVGFVAGGFVLQNVDSDVQVEVIAHRGAAGLRPENTLASVRQAVEDRADWVEIDVQETADGQIVVMHDSDFMKQAGVDLKVWEATVQDLATIDIGSWFDPAYADQRPALLQDVLAITRDRANLLIELKYYGHDVDLENRTIAIVEAAGMADQVATMSLKYPAVQKMKGLRPDWRAGVLAATAVGDLTRLDADFIAINSAAVGPRLVRAAQEAGKRIYVWTVNDPVQMSAMMSLGVDGLITDNPALVHQVMAFRDTLTTPERVFLLLFERFGLKTS